MSTSLFDDIFTIDSVDTGKYDKVARVVASSTSSQQTKLTLDVNSELFPVSQGDNFTLTLAKSLSMDEGASSWRPKAGERSLMDDYDYVMHGTVYKFQETSATSVQVYVSFGGLLLCLEGEFRTLANLKQENLYLLMRR